MVWLQLYMMLKVPTSGIEYVNGCRNTCAQKSRNVANSYPETSCIRWKTQVGRQADRTSPSEKFEIDAIYGPIINKLGPMNLPYKARKPSHRIDSEREAKPRSKEHGFLGSESTSSISSPTTR